MGKQNKVQELWHSIPLVWREEIVSVAQTFLAAFVVAVSVSVDVTGTTSISTDVALAIVLAAARSGLKAVWVLIMKQIASWK